ncbi:MAG: hypothetical protein M1829_003713, partial [Trizodia sp. TS-e1964]
MKERKSSPTKQLTIWNDITSAFAKEQSFLTLDCLRQKGKSIQQRRMSSEQDLRHFQRLTVEDQTSAINEKFYGNENLRIKFHLRDSITFDYHSNILSPDPELDAGLQGMSLSEAKVLSGVPRLAPTNF